VDQGREVAGVIGHLFAGISFTLGPRMQVFVPDQDQPVILHVEGRRPERLNPEG
jgi:hypothetical protein